MSDDEMIYVYFVLPENATESDVSDVMMEAYHLCEDAGVITSWIRDKNWEPNKNKLSKTTVVFERFEGRLFDKLKDTKCIVVGPWVLVTCLLERKQIPRFKWPMQNVAMLNCIVCVSHLSNSRKLEIKQKVQLMGGYYDTVLTSATTHLVAESVLSEKYLKGAEIGVKLMVSEWVDAVYESSQSANVHADNEQFAKYRCPCFYKLTICATGIKDSARRAELGLLIASNGGVLTSHMRSKDTNVLIVHGQAGLNSQKYQTARGYPHIKCVTIDWIKDSVCKGYALPHEKYSVPTSLTTTHQMTSTPEKNPCSNPNFSTLSVIQAPSSAGNQHQRLMSLVEESQLPSDTNTSLSQLSNNEEISQPIVDELQVLIDGIDMGVVKRAGQYLDGCSVYLAGFTEGQREKLLKVLSLSGATRYDSISDRLTHVIVGNLNSAEVRAVYMHGYSCSIVSLHWLLDSLRKRTAMAELSYLIPNAEQHRSDSTSAIQKGLKLLRTNSSSTITIADGNCGEDGYVEKLGVSRNNNSTLVGPATNSHPPQFRGAPHTATSENQHLFDENMDDFYLVDKYGMCANKTKTVVNEPSSRLDKNDSRTKDTLADLLDQQDQPMELQLSQSTTSSTTDSVNLLFSRFKFILYDIPDEIRDAMRLAGATITSDDQNADYAVTYSCIHSNHIVRNTKAKAIVNDLWIMETLTNNEIQLPLKYYHKPIIICEGSPLTDCVITVTQYANFERKFYHRLIEALGGVSQDRLARMTMPNLGNGRNGVHRSTHLLAPEMFSGGQKYEAARKWGVPVVSSKWLLACAQSGQKENVENFEVQKTDSGQWQPNNCASSFMASAIYDGLTTTLGQKSCTSHLGTDIPQGKCTNVEVPRVQLAPGARSNDSPDTFPTPPRIATLPTGGNAIDTPDRLSQITPVKRIMQEARQSNLLSNSPDTPARIRNVLGEIRTPDTPYGAFLRPNPSPALRKTILKYVNGFPDPPTPYSKQKDRRLSTPMSALKRRFLAAIAARGENPSPSCASSSPQNNSGMDIDSCGGDSDQTNNQLDEMVPSGTTNYNERVQCDDDSATAMETDSETEKAIPSGYRTPPNHSTQDVRLNAKLKQLEDLMKSTNSSASRRASIKIQTSNLPESLPEQTKETQPLTVGWDYEEQCNVRLDTGSRPDCVPAPMIENKPQDILRAVPNNTQPRIFMISGLDSNAKVAYVQKLSQLPGARVSMCNDYDPNCTNLLCDKVLRNEKILACMAAGKRVLHISYVDRCLELGKFAEEAEFEFGNPKFAVRQMESNKEILSRMKAIYWWRIEIARRGYGAFNDMRFIILSNKRESLVRIIEAGGGVVVNAEPPFREEIHATHCLVELRTKPMKIEDLVPLARRGIYCLNAVYISDFLHRTCPEDIRESVLPALKQYFIKPLPML